MNFKGDDCVGIRRVSVLGILACVVNRHDNDFMVVKSEEKCKI